jgi:hypothetical protein
VATLRMSLFAIAILPAVAAAQRVAGNVVSDESGTPVAGAIISAYAGKDTLAATLSRVDGRFLLAVPARRELTLLVRAVGFRPVRIPFTTTGDTTVNVRMPRIAFRLQAIRVGGITSCSKVQTGTADVMDVWTEVTTALENTRLARSSDKRRYHYLLYQYLTDASTGRIRTLRNDTSSWVASRPFKVTAPSELAKKGYVIEDPARLGIRSRIGTDGEAPLLYRAPDEMVLLDESFQTTHCFWASHGEAANAGMIGVYFMPVSGIRINDIRGVFWIDSASYELKGLEYVYTQIAPAPGRNANEDAAAADSVTPGMQPGLANPQPGGIIRFRRMPDGSFIIPDWSIFLNDTWSRRAVPGQPLRQPRMLHETGGSVLRISGG